MRVLRSDRLEVRYPKALDRLFVSIIERTQPSPCETRTKHDYSSPGNHTRSEVDNSIVCMKSGRCVTEGVRYMRGTKLDLFNCCVGDLQPLVS